jgi:outer membrane protein
MKFFLLILLLLFSTTAFAEQLTLQEAINSAYDNNPDLKAQNYSLEATKSQRFKAYGGFLPQVAIDVNNGSQHTRITDGAEIKGGTNKRSISLSQEIFNGGGTYFDIKRASSEIEKEKAVKDAKEQEVIVSVIQAYLDILRYEELLEIEKDNLQSQEKILTYIKQKHSARDATKSEFAKANADHIASINSKVVTENNLNSAKSIFAKLTGIMVSENGILKKIDDNSFYKKLGELDVNNLFEIALKNNPDIRAAKYSMSAARHSSSMAKSSLSPSLRATFTSSQEKNPLYYNNHTYKNNSAFLNLHIPIFSSGVEYSQISEANNVFKSQKYSFDAAKNVVKQQISQSLNEIKNLYAQYESAKEQEVANQLYVEALKQEERLGTKSIIDLLQGKKELYQAKLSRGNLYYDKIVRVFVLKNLMGELFYRNVSKGDILQDFSYEVKNYKVERFVVPVVEKKRYRLKRVK